MATTKLTSAEAQRKVDAIDKRIDTVRAEMYRLAGIDPDAFDYETEEGKDAALTAFTNARRDFSGHVGIEGGLFLRRYDATCERDAALAREERAAQRAALRAIPKPTKCPTCGFVTLLAA